MEHKEKAVIIMTPSYFFLCVCVSKGTFKKHDVGFVLRPWFFKALGISLNRSDIPPPTPHPLSQSFSLYLCHYRSRPRPVCMIHSLAPTPLENSL